jgi:hypothetical protein
MLPVLGGIAGGAVGVLLCWCLDLPLWPGIIASGLIVLGVAVQAATSR